MSAEKIAKILNVNEVRLMHGPKGVAFHARVGAAWSSATISHADLGTDKHRLMAMTKGLVQLAEDLNRTLGRTDDLRKTISGATRAAVEADRAADLRRAYDRESYGRQQRWVQPVEPTAPPAPADSPAGPAVSEPMPSRFHAVMAELGDL